MAHDVFISHSKRDKSTADAVCHALEAEGIRCWIAPRDISAGRSWKQSIVEAIRTSKMMVLIFSGEANRSSQVQREVDIAFESGHPILPFRIEDVEMNDDLYYCVAARHWLDALTDEKDEQIAELVKSVQTLVPESSQPAPGGAPQPLTGQAPPPPTGEAHPPPKVEAPAPPARFAWRPPKGVVRGVATAAVTIALFFGIRAVMTGPEANDVTEPASDASPATARLGDGAPSDASTEGEVGARSRIEAGDDRSGEALPPGDGSSSETWTAPGDFTVEGLTSRVTVQTEAPLDLTRLTLARRSDRALSLLSGRIRNTGDSTLCAVSVRDIIFLFEGGGAATESTAWTRGVHRVSTGTGATFDSCIDPGMEAPFYSSVDLPDGAAVASVALELRRSTSPMRDPVARLELDGPLSLIDCAASSRPYTGFRGRLRSTGSGSAFTKTISVLIVLLDEFGNGVDMVPGRLSADLEIAPGDTFNFSTALGLRACGLTPSDYRVHVAWNDPPPGT